MNADRFSLSIDHRTFPTVTQTPEAAVFIAIIYQAVLDLFAPVPTRTRTKDDRFAITRWRNDRKTAMDYLFGDSGFEDHCHLIGLDPDVIRDGIRLRLRE